MSSILKLLIGAVLGAAGGFVYYKMVGCPTGSCPITKTPIRSTIYGAVLGLMLAAS